MNTVGTLIRHVDSHGRINRWGVGAAASYSQIMRPVSLLPSTPTMLHAARLSLAYLDMHALVESVSMGVSRSQSAGLVAAPQVHHSSTVAWTHALQLDQSTPLKR